MKNPWKMLRSLPPAKIQAEKFVRIERPHHKITKSARIFIGTRTYIGSNALIMPISEHGGVSYNPHIRIGSGVYIGPNVYLVAIDKVEIGNGCVLSEHIFISDNSHGLDPDAGPFITQPLIPGGEVVIGEKCFIGLRAAILPGVTLGNNCIVGTGSVVTKSFPAWSMIAGNPAKLVKTYCHEAKEWRKSSKSPESSMQTTVI